MINVLIVDDHDLVRSGLKKLLADVNGIRVSAEAESGEEALEAIRQRRPDVVLMDVSMPGIGGMETTRRIKQHYPDLPVIVLTMHTDEPYPARLLKAGASGYLHKSCDIEEIVKAIKEVNGGNRYLCSDIAQSLALSSLQPGNDTSPLDTLSERELQVMYMVIQGEKVQTISEKLCLSPKTISTYRYRLFDKLNVKNDADLTRLAMRYGLLDGLS